MPASGVHFNGSVNLPDTETVLREIGSRVPRGLTRVPDGETGERLGFIGFQVARIHAMGEFRSSWEPGEPALADGVRAEDIAWPDLGYAQAYLESYATLKALRDEGAVPADVRLQVQYPTPRAPTNQFLAAADGDAITRSYAAALVGDLHRLLAQVPHDDVAVQWDVALEIPYLEIARRGSTEVVEHGVRRAFAAMLDLAPTRDDLAADVAACVDHVPATVPCGLHLCYGDREHRHAVQPASLAVQVEFLDAVSTAADRPVDHASITVPQDRDDDEFFAPLAGLRTSAATALSFGLVPYHPDEQADGVTAAQVAAIDRHLARTPDGTRGWGVATECGLGRVERGDVPRLLDLHRVLLQAHGGGARP